MSISAYTFNVIFFTSLMIFLIGFLIFAIRNNLIMKLIGMELMLNSVNLLFVMFNKIHGNQDGQIMVLFIMIIAAAEVAIAISILVNLFRFNRSLLTDQNKV